MVNMETLADKLPDVWFDWYARLIPGTIGLTIYLLGIDYFCKLPDLSQIVAVMFGGYLVGHVFQPVSSFFVKKIENLYKNENKYAKAKSNTKIKSSSIRKVSKAHAEANSMFTIALVCIPNLIYFCGQIQYWIAGGMIYFILMTFERVRARNIKIEKLEKEIIN